MGCGIVELIARRCNPTPQIRMELRLHLPFVEFTTYSCLAALKRRLAPNNHRRHRRGAGAGHRQSVGAQDPQRRAQRRVLALCGVLQALGHGLPLVGLTKVSCVWGR